MPITAGTRLEHYEIRCLLGQGAMGEVYLAEDLSLKRPVALKVLAEGFAADRQRVGRFIQEARAASLLIHPNVVHIYGVGAASGVDFIAMEYVDGGTLRRRLAESSVSVAEALTVASQIASALAAAHAAGLIHRDIKPENIMMRPDGYVKVLDFGLAKTPTAASAPHPVGPDSQTVSVFDTEPGVVMGTISYMSPEQARGLEVDARTDLWSLGVVLYEMLAGRRPFAGPTPSDVLASLLRQEPPPLSAFLPEVPGELERIVAKALAKDRTVRYESAGQMLDDVQALRHSIEFETALSGSRVPSGAKFPALASSSGKPAPVTPFEASGAPPAPRRAEQRLFVQIVRRYKKTAAAALALLLCSAAALAISRLIARDRPQPSHLALTRLTFDTGLQSDPTWSPDGRFIAYSSDRKGNFDVWVQPVEGGDPIQVTSSPAADWQPDWSPDGKSIVFRSEREGGGLFLVPAFGGVERMVSAFGYRPQWSPDGSKILLLSFGQRIFDYPKVFVVTPHDARPREVQTLVGDNKEEGVRQSSITWHPDSHRVSFFTMDGGFWTVPVAGGRAVKSEVASEVEAQLKDTGVSLGNFRWAPTGRALYFEGRSRGVTNLWRVPVEPGTLRWRGRVERLTVGLGQDINLAVSPDGKRIAFTTATQSTRVWLLPFDSHAGRIKEPGQPVTQPDATAWFVDLSRDGKRMVYSTNKYGTEQSELRERSLADGRDVLLAADRYYRFFPRWSPDATRLAYSRFGLLDPAAAVSSQLPKGTQKAGPIALLDRQTGREQFLTSPGPWLDYMNDWSPDGQWVLGSTNRNAHDRWEITLFPLAEAPHAETGMRVIASDPENSLWIPRFSPDGRWICYVAQRTVSANASVVYVVPTAGGTPSRITDINSWADWPRWSSDGKTIYFASNGNSTFVNIWGLRFDPAAGKPAGEPFRVTNFESPSRMLSTRLAHTEMSLAEGLLALPIMEVSGSIWVLDNIER